MICNITGMDLSNAGVYDGSTACAEAVLMACRIKKRNKVLVASTLNPDYQKVIQTYATAIGIDVDFIPSSGTTLNTKSLDEIDEKEYAGILVQYPNYFGDIENMEVISENSKKLDTLLITCSDPAALTVLKSPSEFDTDIAVGDIVIHNRTPMFVKALPNESTNTITCVDVSAGEQKHIIPTVSPFGFNFITKVVSFFDMVSNVPTSDAPFGNMLPFMLMVDRQITG
jgi:hypothetical protein